MVKENFFIEHANYPDGSTGTPYEAILEARKTYGKYCLTINLEEGLKLMEKLRLYNFLVYCYFISPCTKYDLVNNTTEYLEILSQRMKERNRKSDNIQDRLKKALEYKEMYFANVENLLYIVNSKSRTTEAVEEVVAMSSFQE